MPLISSCNIACGGHAGDIDSIRDIALLAHQYKVKVGAHPSYPDKGNFGRLSLMISEEDLIQSIQYQLKVFTSILKEENISFHHIKPHGALYNDIAKNDALALVFLKSINEYKKDVILYVPYDSAIEKQALNRGFKIMYEAFVDRNYNRDLSLVSRKHADALIEKPALVLEHLLYMVKQHKVKTLSDELVEIKANTFCVHGDTISAVKILMYLRDELIAHNLQI